MAYISGTYGSDALYSSNGSDSLYGYAGEDTLYGNGGADTLIGGTISDYYADDNNNVIFKIGDGRIVVNQGKDLVIPVYNAEGKTLVTYFREN